MIRIFQRLVVVCITIAATSCATRNQPPHSLDAFVAERDPPLVLRTPSQGMMKIEALSPDQEFGRGVFMGVFGGLFGAIGTGGLSLIGIPLAPYLGAQMADGAAKCNAQLEAAIGNVPAWFNENIGTFPAAQFLEDEIRARFVDRGRDGVLYGSIIETGDGSIDQRELQLVSEKLKAPVLVIVDTRFNLVWDYGDSVRKDICTVTFKARTFLRAIDPAQPDLDKPLAYESVLITLPKINPQNVQFWVKDPEKARDWIRDGLREVAESIVTFYPRRESVAPIK